MTQLLHYKTKKPINFIKYEYKIGDSVKLNFNACSQNCMCFWDKEIADFLNEEKIYTIEDITYFGGGCPPLFLHLKNVPQTSKKEKNWWEAGVPANWFKPV